MRESATGALLLALSLAGCAGASEPSERNEADGLALEEQALGGHDEGRDLAGAFVQARSDSELGGLVTLTRTHAGIKLFLTVVDAPPGVHGVHLHETGDCSAPDASSAGAHWNPTGAAHGAPGEGSHLGDLGNLEIDALGRGVLTLRTHALTLGDGAATDVVGKALVIHAQPDDLTTQPSGNAGARIGCGVIR